MMLIGQGRCLLTGPAAEAEPEPVPEGAILENEGGAMITEYDGGAVITEN